MGSVNYPKTRVRFMMWSYCKLGQMQIYDRFVEQMFTVKTPFLLRTNSNHQRAVFLTFNNLTTQFLKNSTLLLSPECGYIPCS